MTQVIVEHRTSYSRAAEHCRPSCLSCIQTLSLLDSLNANSLPLAKEQLAMNPNHRSFDRRTTGHQHLTPLLATTYHRSKVRRLDLSRISWNRQGCIRYNYPEP